MGLTTLPTATHPAPRTCALIALALGLFGCELSASDLTAYSRTAAGPAKIRVVIEESGYADPLRAEAVVTLLDLNREDVDGEALAFESLEHLPPDEREGLLEALLERLGPRLAADSRLDQAEQVRAKDALSRLCGLPTERALRARYGGLLIEWYARDLQARMGLGSHDLESLVEDQGALAAAPLTEALSARSSAEELATLTQLLAQVATAPEARERAAQKLLDIETRWRSEGRLTLLETRLADAAAPPAEGADAPETAEGADAPEQMGASAKSLRERADAVRHRELERTLLPALGHFAGTQRVADRLLALAKDQSGSVPEPQRERALELLAGHTRPGQVGDLLALAGDHEQRVPLRELALARAAEHAGSGALPQLLAMVSNRRQRSLRQHAAELVLEIGGAGALRAFFRAMPKAWELDYSRSELEAYADHLAELDPDPRTVHLLGKKLHSAYWWARVLALRYFAARGKVEDLWRMRQHVHDHTAIRGSEFPEGYTIAQEAQAAVAMALRRLRSESSPG